MRVGVVALLLGLLVLPIGGVSADPPERDGAGPVDVSVTVSRTNDTAVTYEFSFDVPPKVGDFDVRLYRGVVTDSHGFQVVDSPRLLSWSGDREASISAVRRVDADRDGRCRCAVTDRWMLVQPLRVQMTTSIGANTYRTHLTDWFDGPTADATVSAVEGRFTPGVIYFGPTTERTTTRADGQRLAVLGPNLEEQASPSTVLSTLEDGADRVDLTSGADRPATLGIVPHGVDGGPANALGSRGVAWSQGYALVDGATGPSTWLHEYVHTQERYTTDASMEWFTEASAQYYGRLLAARQRGDSFETFVGTLRDETGSDGVLADPASWHSQFVPYDRGARVLGYLDWQIRQATDGTATFEAVYRRLNGQRGLTVADLKDATAAVVGDRSLDAEIERFVSTAARPETGWGPRLQPATTTVTPSVTVTPKEPSTTSTSSTTGSPLSVTNDAAGIGTASVAGILATLIGLITLLLYRNRM